MTRRVRDVGLALSDTATGRTHALRDGSPVVTVAGPPGELLLWLFGRAGAAQVEFSGPPSAVAAVRATDVGL